MDPDSVSDPLEGGLVTVEERTPSRLRKDARLNREAILEAGRELFAESADVAMCQVARRAGVGQATLYRLRTGGFADAASAQAFCAQAREKQVPCVVIR